MSSSLPLTHGIALDIFVSCLFNSISNRLEEFTPKANWLGGAGGEGSIEALTEVMTANGFVLLEKKELPLVLREHKRKYQWVVSFMSW